MPSQGIGNVLWLEPSNEQILLVLEIPFGSSLNKVSSHACVACPSGKTSTGNHDASGGDTTCDATTCGVNEKVSGHTCEACPSGRTSTGNHDASAGDTTCYATTCGANQDIVNSAVFSADGFSTGECMQTLQGHTDSVNSAVFSADGFSTCECMHWCLYTFHAASAQYTVT